MPRMTPEDASLLRSLLIDQPVAALATLHKGEPAVSMVPFAWWPERCGAVIHVSSLSPHTRDMQQHPSVSCLVTAQLHTVETPLALPRVSLTGQAKPLGRDDPDHTGAREAYLAKLPDAEPLFEFGDFSLWVIEVTSARYVAGFGRAMAVMPDALRAVMSG
jgi:putative heme iron utilization protein